MLSFHALMFGCSVVGLTPICVAGEVTFDRDVRPILSDKCFHCHGPDANKREADLRLDVRDAAVNGGAFVPGSPNESELLRRIMSSDIDERMPPLSSKLEPLTDKEIETLRQWIEKDALYEKHWSFNELPDFLGVLKDRGLDATVNFAIDEPVRVGLAFKKLELQPEADRWTLIRRLRFDLTGLPPTATEVNAFVEDNAPDAYERLVDRLLATEQYGERMAVDWLDTARYADSYGFQVDRERETWPWRDWVIRAFNSNLPFDQFIRWQIAGDLLPNPTDDQILATAFNRLHQQESEGGSVEEEYRVEYIADRVQTFATAFLGLTFECCRCHDHKFDPLTQREYYQFFAMFQNIDEAGLYSFFTSSPPTPTLLLADANAKQKLADLRAAIEKIESSAGELRNSRHAAFDRWKKKRTSQVASIEETHSHSKRMALPIKGELARFRFDAVDEDKLENAIDSEQPVTLKGENKLVAGVQGKAVEFTGDDAVDLPLGNFQRHESFSIALWLKTPDVKERAVVFHRSRAWTDAASRGYELLIEDGRLKWSLIHFWPGNAISITAKDQLPINEWVHVVVTYDGTSRADGLAIFVNGHRAMIEVVKDKLTKEITGGGGDNIAIGERFRDRGFNGGAVDDFRVFGRQLSPLEARWVREEMRPQDLEISHVELTALDSELFEFYLATDDKSWSRYLKDRQEAYQAHNTYIDGLKEMMVMRERPTPKKAYILARGEYSQRGEVVEPGTPAVLLSFPDGAPRNRLGLAEWLVDRRHPLTARVTVNRVWQSIFGRGLVRTSEDFGSQGSRPLYQDVLDRLSWSFIDGGWDMKQLMKTIVMSQTYRQRSIADATVMTDDPDNEWLGRGPRFRLPAEMIRDNALVASGLLSPTLGGPPVFPYEMSEAFKPAKVSEKEGVYRRSLYTQWRRTGPPPAMVAFDAPRRAVCIAKRERTDSPLQALILLNGVQYVEAARVLGESLYRDAQGDLGRIIDQGFMRCLSRPPDEHEIAIVTQLYQEQLQHFQQNDADAELLLSIGNAIRDESIPLAEAAAATVLAQALLNHDVSVVKR
ncbi:MAG: DUF1553 domain-containing protein [Pirellulaceae bacterium]|nr:DUF1553 domain-containing protein [Pirellulaceae bacterium]